MDVGLDVVDVELVALVVELPIEFVTGVVGVAEEAAPELVVSVSAPSVLSALPESVQASASPAISADAKNFAAGEQGMSECFIVSTLIERQVQQTCH